MDRDRLRGEGEGNRNGERWRKERLWERGGGERGVEKEDG